MGLLRQSISGSSCKRVKVSLILARVLVGAVALASASACLLCPLWAAGAEGGPYPAIALADEHTVKSAFLLNFARFTKWPAKAFESKRAPFRIGVLNPGLFFGALTSLSNEEVHGRPVEIVVPETVADMRTCHLLFLNTSHELRIKSLLNELRGASILTVGERTGFCRWGGMIELFVEGKRVRFKVAPTAAKAARLKLSSQLLDVAAELITPTVLSGDEGGEE